MDDNEEGLLTTLKQQFFVHRKEGNNIKALETLGRILEIQTKDLLIVEDDLSVVPTLMYMGQLLPSIGMLNEALETLQRALDIRLRRLGEKHADTAQTYESIGRVFLEQGDGKKAQTMFQNALSFMVECPIPELSDIMILSENVESLSEPCFMSRSQSLAIALRMQGKFSEATKMQKVVLANLLQIYGEDHSDVVMVYTFIAGLLKDQNRLDDALQMLDKSIEICYRLQGMGDFNPTVLIISLRDKSNLLEAQGNFKGATEVLSKVLIIQQETRGEMHVSTAEACESLATVYVRRDMIDVAIETYTTAINIRRTVLGDNHPSIQDGMITLKVSKRHQTAKTLRSQGVTMNAQGDSEKAIQIFLEALVVF
ncbi:unnamed protein product [Cylindrotheca closterium]|uniref:Kinesin light chain n=1 Tax=Cylindrotheca closterium TaxID=2856 RepID=A0AAD2G008_9STRA|nr:unnamed protein product [Cylindrotheca closterium]